MAANASHNRAAQQLKVFGYVLPALVQRTNVVYVDAGGYELAVAVSTLDESAADLLAELCCGVRSLSKGF